MQKMLCTIKNILSTKWATFLILVIAIGSRIIQLLFFFNIRVDRNYQLLATQNFVHGKGISTAAVNPADLSNIIYTPLIKWPPGYSLLLSPFYSFFDNNYLLSSFLLDIIFAIVLIFVCRSILKLLNTPLHLINCYTIVSSFFIYYFYFITSSDAIASTLFVVALYYLLRFLKSQFIWQKAVLLISVLLVACVSMKYLFIPIAYVVPVFLIFKGRLLKNKIYLKTGLSIFISISMTLLSIFLYQKAISGAYSYVSDASSGFFPENLLETYPVIPGSIIKPDTIDLVFPFIHEYLLPIYQFLYLLILVVIVYAFYSFYKKKDFNNYIKIDFFSVSFAVLLATQIFLAVLSLTIASAEDLPGNWWTFIEEPRYYGLSNVLIHLSIFYLLYILIKTTIKPARIFPWLIVLLLIPELSRGIIFTANRLVNYKTEVYSWQTDLKQQQFADNLIQAERRQQKIKNVIVAGPFYYINNRIALFSHLPILDETGKSSISLQLQTKEPVLLFVIVRKTDSENTLNYYQLTNNNILGEMDDYVFYSLKIDPVL